MRALIRAELGKLASVRSTWVLLAAAAAVSVLHAAAAIVTGPEVADVTTDAGMQAVLFSAGVGSMLTLVLGVLITAGEFRHGTITDTYLTTPVRGRVIVAKLAAGLVFGALSGLVSAVATVAVAAPWLAARGHAVPFEETFVWLTLAGAVIWCTGYAAIGVAVGALVRSPALGIVAALAWLFVLEQIVVGFAAGVGRWLPAGAASAVGNDVRSGLLPQWGGALMLALYAAAIAAAAALFTTRRDVT